MPQPRGRVGGARGVRAFAATRWLLGPRGAVRQPRCSGDSSWLLPVARPVRSGPAALGCQSRAGHVCDTHGSHEVSMTYLRGTCSFVRTPTADTMASTFGAHVARDRADAKGTS
eukprot:27543-Chlamydomonas_euryale.AAC.9